MSKSSDNAIVMGSAFFTAFVGIFDTENDRLGFAESIYTLPGSSIKCNKADCTDTDGTIIPSPEPEAPDQSNQESNEQLSLILSIVFFFAAAIIIGIFVYWFRKKNSSTSSRRLESVSWERGKKRGYGIDDEKEDDSDEESDLRIEHARPMLNN